MVILGVLVLVATAVVLVDIGVSSNGTMDVHLLGWHLGGYGPGRILVLGAVIGVALTLGLMLVLSGQLRSRRKRRERDKTIKGTRAENKRLAAQLEQQAKTGGTGPAALAEPVGQVAPYPEASREHTPGSSGNGDANPAEAYPLAAE